MLLHILLVKTEQSALLQDTVILEEKVARATSDKSEMKLLDFFYKWIFFVV